MTETAVQSVRLAARALCVERGDKMLLKEITADIPAGQVSLILGHNGAGKTLLMQTLHGLVTPTSGAVDGPDKDVQKMVFQTPVMLRRTASQHFDFLCPNLDKKEKQDWFRRASLVGQMGVPARAMSGGGSRSWPLSVRWPAARNYCFWMSLQPIWILRPPPLLKK